MISTKTQDMDAYIACFPNDIQKILEQVRATIRKAAPDAAEKIKYAIPTLVFKGNLVHFAAFKNHIGFYAAPTGHQAFDEELSAYKKGKGSVQFPLDKPMPLDLITKIVKFRVAENIEREAIKKKSKK